MATSIFELFGTIMVDNKEANKSIADTDSKATGLAKTLGNGVKTAAKWGAGIATAAGGAVAGMTKFAKSSAAAMDTIDKQSQKMGMSTTAYQEWNHAMELSGMSIDTMKTGMKSLQKAMSGVDEEGNSTSEEFEKLGISLTDANGNLRSAEDIMNETVLALADMEEGAERTAIATKLFGRAGTEMAPMLNQGADAIKGMKQEAHDLGLVMDEDAVKSGAKLNDTLTNLKSSLSAMKTQLGASLIPIVQKFAELLTTYIPKIQAIFDKLAPVLVDMFDKLMPPIMDLADAILPVIFDLIDVLMPIFTQLAEMILPIFVDLINKLAPILGQIAERIMPLLSDLLSAIIPIIDAIWPLISSLLDLLLSLIDPLLSLVQTLLPPITSLIKGLTPLIETVAKILTPIVELISAVLAPVLDVIITLLSPLISLLNTLNPILELLSSLLSPILDLINLILKPVLDFINWIFGDITEGVGDVNDSLGEGGLLGGLGSVSSFIFGDFSSAFSTFGSILGEATSFIGDAFHGIINFLHDPKQAISDFVDWAGQKLQSIKQTFIGLGELIESKVEGAKIHAAYEKTQEAKTQKEAEGWHFVETGDGATTVMNEENYQAYLKRTGKAYAEGGVFEPNKPFVGLLGDQKSGTNVEAPLDTIKQAVREELEQIVVNVQFNVENDTDRLYEIVKNKSWTERQRTDSVQFA